MPVQPPNAERQIWIFTHMLRVREFEERVKRTFTEHPGVIRGHTHLADGAELAATGPEIDVADLVTLPAPERLIRDSVAEGEVLTVDRFGNVQLTIAASDAAEIGLKPGATAHIRCGRHQLTVPYREMFGAVAPGELVAYADSAGLVSIAVNGGDAAQRLGLPPGARVSIAAAPPTIRR